MRFSLINGNRERGSFFLYVQLLYCIVSYRYWYVLLNAEETSLSFKPRGGRGLAGVE